MSIAGSLNTTRGMRLWYAKKKRCKHCTCKKPKILFKGVTPYINMCSGCFKRITGENLKDQFTLFFKADESDDVDHLHIRYVSFLKKKIADGTKSSE